MSKDHNIVNNNINDLFEQFLQSTLLETPYEMGIFDKEHYSLKSKKGDFRKGKTSKEIIDDDSGHTMKEIGNTPTHKFYRQVDKKRVKGRAHFMAVNRETKEPEVSVTGEFHAKKKRLKVDMLKGKPGSSLKAHDFYHHLLLAGHVKELHSDNTQSAGGKKVWHKLSQLPNVNIKTSTGGKVDPKNFEKHYANADQYQNLLAKNRKLHPRDPVNNLNKDPEYKSWKRRSDTHFIAKSNIKEDMTVQEEAPTNSVAGGGIPSLTDGSVVPPKARKRWKEANASGQGILRRKIQTGTFAGMKTFKVPQGVIENARYQKRKFAHWTKYLGEDEVGQEIREWANLNPGEPIILECEKTGVMVFARYSHK